MVLMMRKAAWHGLIFLCFIVGAFAATAALARPALPDFTQLVEANSPAVVNIGTTRKVSMHRGLPPGMEIPDNEMFGELFRRFFGEGGEPEEFDTTSLGSGFIISSDGYVVTNHHVVKDADEIVVKLSDRRELRAELVGSDPRTDMALLKVEGANLTTLKIGSSEDLKVGEWVLAIGSPFGFELSVTAGIVSAKGRSLPSENYVPFIQTDVAINPGNSGGPLFNLDGEVVGINSQIYSRTGGFMGLSFAIPIEVAMDVVEQLKTTGQVSRGWLGVYIQEVTQDLAESFKMDKPSGALVARVLPDSPAEKAGFKVGDVILSFNGREVESSSRLPPIVGSTPVGKKVPVKVLRNGREMTLRVTIEDLPADDELASREAPPADPATRNALGVEVTVPDAETREAYGLEKGGVLVTRVSEGPANAAGIRRGDIIVMLNGKSVDSLKSFEDVVGGLPRGRSVPVLVQRKSGPVFLALKAAE
ncbi:MAG TPA: DegQ family serine endoprotease [Thioalkalivibrio sp.]|nr:DegQ family serine endoprotease [Thioalkalivibrio sp.]